MVVLRRSFSIMTSPAYVPSESLKLMDALAMDFLTVEEVYYSLTRLPYTIDSLISVTVPWVVSGCSALDTEILTFVSLGPFAD